MGSSLKNTILREVDYTLHTDLERIENVESVNKGVRLARLLNNSDFDEIILKGFCEQYVSEGLVGYGSEQCSSDTLLERVKAIQVFRDYLLTLHVRANNINKEE